MKKTKNNSKVDIVIFVIAVFHTAVTFFTDKFVFTFHDRSDPAVYRFFLFDYTICKLIAFVVLFFFYKCIYRTFFDKGRENNTCYQIVRLALPYLFIMIPVCIVKLPGGFLTNDETIIIDNALRVVHYTWFTYITTYYYIVSLMLIPFKLSPIIVKLVIEYFVIGYVVYRFKSYFESHRNNNVLGDNIFAWEAESFVDRHHLREKVFRGSRLFGRSALKIKRGEKRYEIKFYWCAYVLFLLYPVIAYTTSAHRLPIYFLFYLTMVVTFIFDKMEGKELTAAKGFWMLLVAAVLTHFRTEGIYLCVFVPVIMMLVYGNLHLVSVDDKGDGRKFRRENKGNKKNNLVLEARQEEISINRKSRNNYNKKSGKVRFNNGNLKNVFVMLVVAFVLQALVYIPQNVMGVEDIGASATDRMKPFYAYTIVNMMRNGLDRDKNAAELAIVDKYMSLDAIDKINEYYGDINYEDTLILFKGEYYGLRPDTGFTEYFEYADALNTIFKNNPDVFIKTRIGAFVYAAVPYHIQFKFDSGIVKGLIKGLFSVFKAISYNVFIPLIAIFVICIYALIKGRFSTFFITGGLLAHWFIVFILAPASYFKYYFPVYICGYLYILLLIVQIIYNRKALKKISFIR